MPIPTSLSVAEIDRPVRSLLDWAADLEPGGVQLDLRRQIPLLDFGQTARRQFRHLLSERALKLSGLVFPLRAGLATVEGLEERLAALDQALQLAYDLQASALVARMGQPPEDEDEATRLSHVLEQVAAMADRRGVALTLIPSSGSVETLGNHLSPHDATRIAVQFDPAAALFGRENLEESLRALHPWTTQLRVRDGQRDAVTRGEETTIGYGEVDWDIAAGLSHELPYLHWLVIDRTQGDRLKDLERGLKFVRSSFV